MTSHATTSSLSTPLRLDALRSAGLLDSSAEESFDRLTRLAAHVLAAPIALVSFLDDSREIIKSGVGLPEPWASRREIPLARSVCGPLLTAGEPLRIADVREHPLVHADFVVREIGAVAYLGIPIALRGERALGSICVIDIVPRQWTERDVALLSDLAATVAAEVALRAETAERQRLEAALRASEARYQRIAENAPGLVYQFVVEPDGRTSFPIHNNGLPEIFGPNLEAAHFDGSALLDMIHPDDRPSYDRTSAESSRTLTPWHWRGRIIGVSGKVHWIQVASRPTRMPDGRIVRDGVLIDITEHHRVEEERVAALDALRASEDRFHSAFDHAPIGMALATLDGRWELVNPALCHLLGYSEEELLGRPFQEISHPDELPATHALREELLAGERVAYRIEKRYIHKQGHQVWVLVDVTLSRAADGSPRHLIAQVQDISQRKQDEEAVRNAHATLSTLVTAAPLAIVTVDLGEHYTVRSWNPAAERLFGWRADELIGGHYPLVPDDRRAESARLDRTLEREGKVYAVETRRQRKDGSQVDVVLLGTMLPAVAGEPRRAVFFFVDMTEYKQAEEQIRAAHEMLQSLIDLAPQAILAVDTSWNVTIWNHAAERLFGWTAEEVLGGPVPYVPPERLAEFRARQNPEVQERDRAGIETQRRRKDGSLVDVLLSTDVLRNASGEPTGYIAVASDLTEHKALEAQLRQAQKMEAVGQLAGGVAHDFNNLLTVIKVHTELLLERLEPGTPEHGDASGISAAATRASSLTRQLLAFSRKQLLRPQVLDLNTTVAGLVPMLQRLIGEDIEVVTELAPSLGQVMADPAQLEQVLVNLAVNARDAMPHGGVLRIETANVQVGATYTHARNMAVAPGPYVMITVGDTGCGMDEETQSRIFEPFFTTKDPGRGTGLGLSTVYGIIKQSGGYVWVHSEPDRGTRFTIYLPRAVNAAPTPSHGVAAVAPQGSETVLLIEDEDAVRHLVCRVLKQQGYTVLEARDGDEALRMLADYEGPIDLVVTDLVMPGLSGRALVEELASKHRRFKVLFVSGYTDDEIIRRGLLDPRVEFLEKPFTVNSFAQRVREVLDSPSRGRWPPET